MGNRMSIPRPELSIIIVNWNTMRLLKGCLESIASAKKYLTLEVIVVDNGSTDGSVEMCQKFFPEVRIIRNRNNFGYGHLGGLEGKIP